MLTVALREIRASARRPITYWSRCMAAAVGAGILLFMMMQASFGMLNGSSLFLTAVTIAFGLCLFDGVRQASTAIVDERVSGTLGLLLLTRIRGDELLLGKFASLAFSSFQTLIAFTPVLAMSLLLGGVSVGEMLRAALVLFVAIIFALTVGLVISARSREPFRAMTGTFIFLLLTAIILSLDLWPKAGLPAFVFRSLSPMTPIWTIPDLSYTAFTAEFWLSILTTTTACAALLWQTSRRLFARFAEDSAKENIQPLDPTAKNYQSFTTVTEQQALNRSRWFKGNPIAWLTLRHLNLRGRVAAPIIIALIIGVAIYLANYWGILLGVVMYLIFGFLFSAGATMTLARARQTGELELWLTTPLGYTAILQGIHSVLSKVFIWPGFILLIVFMTSIYLRVIVPAQIQITMNAPGFPSDPTWSIIYLLATTLVSLLAFLFTFPHVAMWIALKTKNPTQAAVRTFLWMVLAPWLIFCVPKWLLFIPLGLVAAHTVRTTLKNFATQRLPAP